MPKLNCKKYYTLYMNVKIINGKKLWMIHNIYNRDKGYLDN